MPVRKLNCQVKEVVTTCDHLRLPVTTCDNLGLSATTRDYLRQLVTTCGYPCQLSTTCDYLRLPATTTTCDNLRLLTITCDYDYFRQHATTYDYLRLRLLATTCDYPANEDETRWKWCSPRMQGGKREIPEKTRRPVTLSGTTFTCEKPGSDSTGNRTQFAMRPPSGYEDRVSSSMTRKLLITMTTVDDFSSCTPSFIKLAIMVLGNAKYRQPDGVFKSDMLSEAVVNFYGFLMPAPSEMECLMIGGADSRHLDKLWHWLFTVNRALSKVSVRDLNPTAEKDLQLELRSPPSSTTFFNCHETLLLAAHSLLTLECDLLSSQFQIQLRPPYKKISMGQLGPCLNWPREHALSCSFSRMTSQRALSGHLNSSEREQKSESTERARTVCLTSERNERVVVSIPQSERTREREAVLSPGCAKECSLERVFFKLSHGLIDQNTPNYLIREGNEDVEHRLPT
ncbi:hypothetical protein PR048_001252 [Dryococelus australis]|uniref:Uncharacterized protein n=1 Tax=Dryococelus australis TaxID=614101 RepID=A0ABQ9IHH4_9NEOP|nr:hypothetical protein PR048_001252 [Dryococelus australis]